MIRRPPGSPQSRSSAASDVYKRQEYERDVARGIDPDVPAHYFPDDDPAREPLNIWCSQAQLLYTNWLNYYVYQTTPYDIRLAGRLARRRAGLV